MYKTENIEEIANSYENLTGIKEKITSDFDDILRAILKGEKAILVDLEWNEEIDGEFYKRNKIVINDIQETYIIFSNPIKRGDEVFGLLISGENKGPDRKINADMTQSINIDLFQNIFLNHNGKALVKNN
ncbi:MAG: hypothetical protein AABZ74_09255 [Cyanobacteriota bacterium]